MPIYEFVCLDCNTHFEHLQSFSTKGHPPCPNCASMHVSRMLGKPAIHFKGSGWYVTDSKGAGKQSANGEGAGKDAASKEGASSESAGDAAGESSAPKDTAATAGAPDAKAAAGQSRSQARIEAYCQACGRIESASALGRASSERRSRPFLRHTPQPGAGKTGCLNLRRMVYNAPDCAVQPPGPTAAARTQSLQPTPSA